MTTTGFPLKISFPILQVTGPAQVHLFSAGEDISEHPVISELIRTGKLVAHPETLAWALEQADSQGFVHLGTPSDWEESGRRVTLRHGPILLPRDLWNRVNNSATLMDDHILSSSLSHLSRCSLLGVQAFPIRVWNSTPVVWICKGVRVSS